MKRVEDWTAPAEPEDDRTVVVVKRHPGPAPGGDTGTTTGMQKVAP